MITTGFVRENEQQMFAQFRHQASAGAVIDIYEKRHQLSIFTSYTAMTSGHIPSRPSAPSGGCDARTCR